MIGSLLYLGIRTRPDKLAPVLILARFQKAPTAFCHRGAKRVLGYIRGSQNHGLLYCADGLDLHAFVDADFAADTVKRNSISRYMVKLGNAICYWGLKKQATVEVSTCES